MSGDSLVTVEVGPFVVVVQRVDHGNTAEIRPTYRVLVRREDPVEAKRWRVRIAYFYAAKGVEASAWSWGDVVESLDDHRRIEAAVERVVEAAAVELDAELAYRRARRGLVEHA